MNHCPPSLATNKVTIIKHSTSFIFTTWKFQSKLWLISDLSACYWNPKPSTLPDANLLNVISGELEINVKILKINTYWCLWGIRHCLWGIRRCLWGNRKLACRSWLAAHRRKHFSECVNLRHFSKQLPRSSQMGRHLGPQLGSGPAARI